MTPLIRTVAIGALFLAAGSAVAQPMRGSTVSVTVVNQSDTRVTMLTTRGGTCGGTATLNGVDPGGKTVVTFGFPGSCGRVSSVDGVSVQFASGQTIGCPKLYSGGGAYVTGQNGQFGCVSGPYH